MESHMTIISGVLSPNMTPTPILQNHRKYLRALKNMCIRVTKKDLEM